MVFALSGCATTWEDRLYEVESGRGPGFATWIGRPIREFIEYMGTSPHYKSVDARGNGYVAWVNYNGEKNLQAVIQEWKVVNVIVS